MAKSAALSLSGERMGGNDEGEGEGVNLSSMQLRIVGVTVAERKQNALSWPSTTAESCHCCLTYGCSSAFLDFRLVHGSLNELSLISHFSSICRVPS